MARGKAGGDAPPKETTPRKLSGDDTAGLRSIRRAGALRLAEGAMGARAQISQAKGTDGALPLARGFCL